jgi:beta-1,4-mannosyl-glycoprotein beta-1,4-N-acetylglucosaminyltransferase
LYLTIKTVRLQVNPLRKASIVSRLYDCFLFFNELDLLEIRLNELSSVVDKFVLAESTTTFTGFPKPLYFEENRARYEMHADKIVHIIFENPLAAATSPWAREFAQRDALDRGLANAQIDDLVLLSDADEIPDPRVLRQLKESPPHRNEVACLELRMFYYYVNFEAEQRWLRSGPRCVVRDGLVGMQRLRNIRGPHPNPVRDSIRGFRTWRNFGRHVRRRVVRNAGWHFSYLGGIEAIQAKLRAFSGGEKIAPKFTDRNQSRARIGQGLAPVDEQRLALKALDMSFPCYLLANRERFADLIADDATLAAHRSFVTEPTSGCETAGWRGV